MRIDSRSGRIAASFFVKALAAVMLGAAPVGCAQILAGALTAGQALLLTPETETAIGREAADEFLLEHPSIADRGVQELVRRVGDAVAARSSRPAAAYGFHAVQAAEPNAFALPGGPIFITAGLLVRLDDEAQLAGILAHEVAHVAERHGVGRLRDALVLQGIAIAALGDQSEALRRAAAIALDLVVKGRDRQSEAQADLLGTRWMAQAGYDPQAVIDTLEMFRQLGEVPGFLVWATDHPALSDRMGDVQAQIAAEGLAAGTRASEAYRRAIAPLK